MLPKSFDYHYFVTRPTGSIEEYEDTKNCQFRGDSFF